MTKKEHWITARGCVYNANYHFVWSAKEKGITLVSQEIMPDHVHLFIIMHPKFAPANIVKIFKGITAKKLFEMHPEIKNKLSNGHL